VICLKNPWGRVGFVSDFKFENLQTIGITSFSSIYKQSSRDHHLYLNNPQKHNLNTSKSLRFLSFHSEKSQIRQMRLNAHRPINIHLGRVGFVSDVFSQIRTYEFLINLSLPTKQTTRMAA